MASAIATPRKGTPGKYSKTNPNPSLEAITPGAFYSRQQVMAMMGWGRKSYESAKRKGLPTHRHASRDYVHGEELTRFLLSLDRNGQPSDSA